MFSGVDIGEAFRAARGRAKLTQEALARGSGLSVGTISRIERGDTDLPDLTTVAVVARALPSEQDRGDFLRDVVRAALEITDKTAVGALEGLAADQLRAPDRAQGDAASSDGLARAARKRDTLK